MTTPPGNSSPTKPPLHERLLDKLVDSPFATLWNLTVIVGGLIALIYFTQLGYLPDMDLKSSAAFFLSIAVLSMFLVGLLILVFSVPSWMLRTELRQTNESRPASVDTSRPRGLEWLLRRVGLLVDDRVVRPRSRSRAAGKENSMGGCCCDGDQRTPAGRLSPQPDGAYFYAVGCLGNGVAIILVASAHAGSNSGGRWCFARARRSVHFPIDNR